MECSVPVLQVVQFSQAAQSIRICLLEAIALLSLLPEPLDVLEAFV